MAVKLKVWSFIFIGTLINIGLSFYVNDVAKTGHSYAGYWLSFFISPAAFLSYLQYLKFIKNKPNKNQLLKPLLKPSFFLAIYLGLIILIILYTPILLYEDYPFDIRVDFFELIQFTIFFELLVLIPNFIYQLGIYLLLKIISL